jgi:hypothetical protein
MTTLSAPLTSASDFPDVPVVFHHDPAAPRYMWAPAHTSDLDGLLTAVNYVLYGTIAFLVAYGAAVATRQLTRRGLQRPQIDHRRSFSHLASAVCFALTLLLAAHLHTLPVPVKTEAKPLRSMLAFDSRDDGTTLYRSREDAIHHATAVEPDGATAIRYTWGTWPTEYHVQATGQGWLPEDLDRIDDAVTAAYGIEPLVPGTPPTFVETGEDVIAQALQGTTYVVDREARNCAVLLGKTRRNALGEPLTTQIQAVICQYPGGGVEQLEITHGRH